MNKDKLIGIIQGILFIVFGILVAINGGASAMDTYLGIVGLVAGSLLIILAIVSLIKTKQLPFGALAIGGIALTIGGALLAQDLTFAGIIWILLFALMGLGGALIIYGVYAICKGAPVVGIAQLLIGIAFIVLPLCYIHVDGFQKAFWITVGIVMVVYGCLVIVSQFIDTKALSKKK